MTCTTVTFLLHNYFSYLTNSTCCSIISHAFCWPGLKESELQSPQSFFVFFFWLCLYHWFSQITVICTLPSGTLFQPSQAYFMLFPSYIRLFAWLLVSSLYSLLFCCILSILALMVELFWAIINMESVSLFECPLYNYIFVLFTILFSNVFFCILEKF